MSSAVQIWIPRNHVRATCDLAPTADPATTTPAAPSSETATDATDPTMSADAPPERPQPIPLGNGGSISR